jgi:hypothetical protein
MERTPWWLDARIRLALLLGCLALAVLGLVVSRTGLPSRHGDGDVAAPKLACGHPTPPPLVDLRLSAVRSLRSSMNPLFAAIHGRRYQSGTIPTTNVWSDGYPSSLVGSREPDGHWAAGYEMRQWAPNGDDVVADVFRFASSRAAARFVAQASGSACRRTVIRSAVMGTLVVHNLTWDNPEDAFEIDAILAIGSRVYRIGDVPPRHALASVERGMPARLDLLACALPGAGCGAYAS